MEQKKTTSFIFKLLFVITFFAMSCIFSTIGGIKHIIFGLIISLIIICTACFAFNIPQKLINSYNKKLLIFSIITGIITTLYCALYFFDRTQKLWEKIPNLNSVSQTMKTSFSYGSSIILGLLSAPAFVILLYFFYGKMFEFFKDFFKQTPKQELITLSCFLLVFAILIVVAFILSSAFYGYYSQYNIPFDVMFTSDSGFLYSTDCWMSVSNPENDIRQPLFGVFALPFSIFPYTLSKILFFIPNIYAILTAITQFALLIIAFFMIAKICKFNFSLKIIFLIGICSTYPTILFSLVLEQYVFAVFYLIFFIYLSCEQKNSNELSFLGATGSALTSGILFPLLIKDKKFKPIFLNLLKTFIIFISLIFVFGKGYCLTTSFTKLKALTSSYGGESLGIISSLKQFFNFVASSFIAPSTQIKFNDNFYSFTLSPVNNFSCLGIAIFVLCIISFIINRKNKFAIISFCWVCFSLLLLGVVGWGASENGMILYTLYFSWAYYSLMFLLIDKLLEKAPIAKYIVLGVLIITILVYNILGLIDILQFATKYYPTR